MEDAEMMNDETKRKLRELNLGEMIDIIEMQSQDQSVVALPFGERIQRMVDYIYQEKYNSKVSRLIKMANFRFRYADINSIHYDGRGLNRQTMQELATTQFTHSYTNVILQGFTGSGKTYLACAIGKQACKQGIRAQYIRMPDLMALRDETSDQNRGLTKLLAKYSAYGLLILDEWLLDDFTDESDHFMFELIERRHDQVSTVFCTQYRKEDWYSRLGGNIHAEAILDRIVHNAIWVEAGNLNMREFAAKEIRDSRQ
jgi:DNA replication protein DnaC